MPSKPPKTVTLSTNPVIPMNIYPTLGSVQEVVELANSKLPVVSQNVMYALLMTFQNTLLKAIHDQTSQPH